VIFTEIGLIVEELELRRSSRLEEVDDALRFRFRLRPAENAIDVVVGRFCHHRGKGHATDPCGGLLEKMASVDGEGVEGWQTHWLGNCISTYGGIEGSFTGNSGVEGCWEDDGCQ